MHNHRLSFFRILYPEFVISIFFLYFFCSEYLLLPSQAFFLPHDGFVCSSFSISQFVASSNVILLPAL